MTRLRIPRRMTRPLEHPSLAPLSRRLAKALPGAVLLPTPPRASTRRLGADGLVRLVLVRRAPPREQAWRVVQAKNGLVLSFGASEAEAVERAIFLWGASASHDGSRVCAR
jgi:hypothetical protein